MYFITVSSILKFCTDSTVHSPGSSQLRRAIF